MLRVEVVCERCGARTPLTPSDYSALQQTGEGGAPEPLAAILRGLGIEPNSPAGSIPAWRLVEAVALRVSGGEPEPQWLPTKEAARYLRTSVSTLQRYAREGPPIVRREGSGRRPDYYRRDSLDAFIEQRHGRMS